MPVKYVFSDVDLTMVGKDHILNSSTIETINKVRKQGVKFVMASGRLPAALNDYLTKLSIDNKEDEYIICGNGSIITNTKFNSLIDKPLKEDNIRKVLNYLNSIDLYHYSLVSKEKYYNTSLAVELIKPGSSKIGELIDKKELEKLVGKINFYKFHIIDYDENKLDTIAKTIVQITSGELNYTFSAKLDLEVVNSDCSKGDAIKEFCKLKNIDLKDTLVIGDNLNDSSMFNKLSLKACPNNAIESIKNKCDYISPLDCEHDAIVDMLNKLVLNK